jgi:hypothetical protein
MSNDIVHEEVYKGLNITIFIDDEPQSPREWDNAGTIACWHRRYSLGELQPKEMPDEFMRNKHISNKTHIILPVYMYDHSGITISTEHVYPYNDMWDAGQLGIIYISRKDAVKNWGTKKCTKNVETTARTVLKGEIKDYDNFLRGNVYGYQVTDNGEVLDMCWGFYPDDDDKNDYDYALREAKEAVD